MGDLIEMKTKTTKINFEKIICFLIVVFIASTIILGSGIFQFSNGTSVWVWDNNQSFNIYVGQTKTVNNVTFTYISRQAIGGLSKGYYYIFNIDGNIINLTPSAAESFFPKYYDFQIGNIVYKFNGDGINGLNILWKDA